MNNFVFPEELTYFIESLRPFPLAKVGSPKWLDVHELVIKLSQQATLEAAEHREEAVQEELISRDKLRVLIHEAICVQLWKTRILPYLLEFDPYPEATFLIYTVLYHEAACVALLDNTLFHASGCEALHGAGALDLVDYCAQGVAQCIGLAAMGHHDVEAAHDVDEAVLTELERQKRDLIFKIGLRCVSLLCYLATNANTLALNVTRRMVVTHDVPWLMVDLLHFRPWQRRTPKGLQRFVDEKWTPVSAEESVRVVKHEAQAWLGLRQLLLNPQLMESYELNEERRCHLAKCQGLLHERTLDQIPPLIDLKQHLCQLSMAGSGAPKRPSLLLEEVPEMHDQLVKEAEREGGFFAIAQRQEPFFLCTDKDKILEMAQRLNAAYNTDLMADLEECMTAAGIDAKESTTPSGPANKCGCCSNAAEKKCANCRTVYYCSRKCQLEDWPQHKASCVKV